MTVTTAKWTIAEYHRLVETGILDDKRVELLHGIIVDMPPEGMPHAVYCTESVTYLRELLGERATVREAHHVYQSETILADGNISPLSFPDLQLDVSKLFTI